MLTLYKGIKYKPENIYRKQVSGNDIKHLKNKQRETPELKKGSEGKRSMVGFNNRLDIVEERINEMSEEITQNIAQKDNDR